MSCVSTLTTTRLFREPSSKSNKSLMLQALKFSSLPGPVNAKSRKEVEDSLNNSGASHFMALYKQAKYKGMYEVEHLEDIFKIIKIHGTGPKEVTELMISDLLKYNSGLKSFQSVGSKTLSPAVDGFCLTAACWQTRRPKTTNIK
jgi:calmodulin-regulated spectrin-associated protein